MIKSFKKSFSENYEFVLKGGDYAIFNISSDNKNIGTLQITSSWGDYAHTWGSVGGNFKEFLCEIDRNYYLLSKITKMDTFYFDDYIKDCLKMVLEDRKERILNKKETKKIYDYFKSDMDNFEYPNSIDLVRNEILNTNRLSESLDYFFDSRYLPNYSYSKQVLYLIDNIYPLFVEELKKEIEGVKEND